MRQLLLFAHPDGRTMLHQGGFSWLAMLALPVWALQRGLGTLAALALVWVMLPSPLLLLLGVPEYAALLCAWLLMVGYGFLAAPLHAAWMRRSGWIVLAEEPRRDASAVRP